MKFYTFNQLPIYTDDFSFRSFDGMGIKDAIVIHNPMDALIVSPVYIRSRKSLEEHIEYINANRINKAFVIAEDIRFLKDCPCIEHLRVHPAIGAAAFDYSPIYDLPHLKMLACDTMYGLDEKQITHIDYSHFTKINKLIISGAKGHHHVESAASVSSLAFYDGFPNSKFLTNTFPPAELVDFSITLSPIVSLEGIQSAQKLRRLALNWNRRLTDISALGHLSESLESLEINTCGKIKDFSVLAALHNLERLVLKGNNVIPNLLFLTNLPKLKYFHITMNVEDGKLDLCERIPGVIVQNRRHYSHQDKDLPKNFSAL